MSSDDPTKKYPPPEDYLTRNNLEEMLTNVVRRVIAQDVLPRLDRMETEITEVKDRLGRVETEVHGLKIEVKDLKRDFRNYRNETFREMAELEDRVEHLEKPKT